MYSQNLEDEFVLELLGKNGTVLSVGENDGITFSNSRYLIEQGWSGYLLEPGLTFTKLQDLYLNHPKVWCYNYGITLTGEDQYFFESGSHVAGGSDSGLVSTTIEDETVKWKQAGVQFTQIQAKFKTFAQFYEEAGEPQLDFISVDVEGNDWQVLQQIDLNKVGCKALCIEWNSDPKLEWQYEEFCRMFGMKEAVRNAENLIYIR